MLTLPSHVPRAQRNDVEGLSRDGIGYNGPVLRELTDPEGLNLEVTVPLPSPTPRTTFGPERFSLKVIDAQHKEVTCPNGQTAQRRERNRHDTGDRYHFKAKQCAACPLREQCLANPSSKHGGIVIKNDYEAEYAHLEAKAKTAEYQQTRRTHSKIERKLGDVVRHHAGRQARFRGLPKVLMQSVLTALVVNVKRIVKLLSPVVSPTGQTVRAELVQT
jgi:hypothetical protein